MARCKECMHYAVCSKEGRMVQIDEHTWDDYNQLDDVERFCDNYIATADVVPKSEEGAECPICYGTGRIGTTDWLTKGISKKKLAEEKAKAIAEHEQRIKSEVAREIIKDLDSIKEDFIATDELPKACAIRYAMLQIEKKYTEGKKWTMFHPNA